MTTGYFIRDTLVSYATLNLLSEDKQQRIKELTTQYNSLAYTDARYHLGNDQIRRMTDRQRDNLSKTALNVFSIEAEVKELLKNKEQLNKESEELASKQRNDEIQRIQYRIRDIEQYLSKKLNSNRYNPTKIEYADLKQRLAQLQ